MEGFAYAVWVVSSTILLGAVTRAAGGGFVGGFVEGLKAKGGWWRIALAGIIGRLPEAIFALAISETATFLFDLPLWASALAWLWSYIWMEIGHRNGAHMGVSEFDFPDDPGTLGKWIVEPMCRAIEWVFRKIKRPVTIAHRGKTYCWIFMATKGFLVGMPLGIYSLLMALVWPFSYYMAMADQGNIPAKLRSWAPAEWISGMLTRLVLLLAVYAQH